MLTRSIFQFQNILLLSTVFLSWPAFGLIITPDLEVQKLTNVGAAPTVVSFENSYTNPVPVCTYNLPSNTAIDNPATVRISALSGAGMQIRLQDSDGAVNPGEVHCIIADEGDYTLAADGIDFKARTVVSDGTNGSGGGTNWNKNLTENVTASVANTYANPVVIGQVITSNDAAFSTFWTTDCSTNGSENAGRGRPPFSTQATICVGKHKGKLGVLPTNNETLGYMVFNRQVAAGAQVNGIHYTAALGADTVFGVTNNPPYSYNLPNTYNYEFAVATQNAEDGGDGSWAVLYGADPLAGGNIDLAVDETDDPNRNHTNEQVAYVAFAVSELTLEKLVVTDNGGTAVDADFILTYSGSSTASGIEGSDAVTKATILPGTYSLSEANVTGYTASAWTCTGGTLSGSDITLAAGDDVTCTITNDDDPAQLTISKTIVLNNGVAATLADFNVAVNGTEVPWTDPTSSTGGSEVVSTSAGIYTLSEVDFATYLEGAWSCVDDVTSNPVAVTNSGAFDGADVSVALGQSVTCSISNDDEVLTIPSLSVVKTIVSDNGGTNTLDDFNVAVQGAEVAWSNPTSMVGGSELITQVLGTYTLSESDLVGYTEGIWECRDQDGIVVPVTNGGDFSGADITLSTGQALICTITNDDDGGSLTVVKEIINDSGGTGVVGDFGLTTTAGMLNFGLPSGTGTTLDPMVYTATPINGLVAGTYTLSENDVPSYSEGTWTCTGAAGAVISTFNSGSVEIANGEDVVCTISNDDIMPELTVTKSTNTAPMFAGNTATYTIVVSNLSGVTANNVVVTDIPENTAFTYASSSVTLNGGATRPTTSDPAIGAGTMIWSEFTIPVGDSVEIEVTMDVASTLASGVYDNSVALTASNAGATITNYDGTAALNTAEDIVIYQPSALTANLVINEVLYRGLANGAAANDEFIELYNAGGATIDLTMLKLIDGNLVTDDDDGTGSITGSATNPEFNFTCVAGQVCSGSTNLAPGQYAVIWIGDQDLTSKNATGASFQAWLGSTAKLANGADDVWLFGANNEFIDYVAWGNPNSASVNSQYPVGVWDDSVQTSLDGNPAGISISLTPNGIDGNESDCWEETISTDSSARCTGYLPTIDTDAFSTRVTSVGGNNNGGTIIIEKQTLPDANAQSFEFTGEITATLTDGDSSTPINVGPGSYTVVETAVAGWNLTSIVCDDADSIGDIATSTATFNVVVGETITCVFTNTQAASLSLNKVVNNSPDGGTATAADWTLEANIAGGTAELSGPSGVSSATLVPGDYVLSETAGPAGYTLDSLACDVGTLDAGTNTLTLTPGDVSICTFTNRDLITDLQVSKTVSDFNPTPGSATPITFTLTVTNNGPDPATNVVVDDIVLSGFTFVANSMTETADIAANQSAPNLQWVITDLAVGAGNAVTLTYQVTVNAP